MIRKVYIYSFGSDHEQIFPEQILPAYQGSLVKYPSGKILLTFSWDQDEFHK